MADPNIRYTRLSDILDLVFLMAKEPLGVTINDIKIRYCVSRRTAERMRDAIRNEFPQVDVVNDGCKEKRWGFINYSMREIVEFTDSEISALQTLKTNSTPEIASIIYKMKVLRRKCI